MQRKNTKSNLNIADCVSISLDVPSERLQISENGTF